MSAIRLERVATRVGGPRPQTQGDAPKDFFQKKIAMMWTTTGSLTNLKNNAKFDFGVARDAQTEATRILRTCK